MPQSPPRGPSVARRAIRALPSRWKQRIADLLCHPVVGRALGALYGARMPLAGLRIDTDAPSVAPRTRAEMFWGLYESGELRFVHQYLRGDRDVVELGASLGAVSCHVARRLEPGRRMVCVEANPALHELIRRNLAENAPDCAVELVSAAIDYEATSDTTRLELGKTTAASRLSRGAAGVPSSTEVPVTTLSQILERTGIDRYTLVSDIEGAEAGIVLEDAEGLGRCDQILAELHDSEFRGRRIAYEDLARELSARHGFREVASHGPVYVFQR